MNRSQLLARHYRQLRTTHGTVLLGPPSPDEATEIDPSWFVNDCPRDPSDAVGVIAKRHGLRSRRAALAALRKSRRGLEADGGPDAEALADLPER